MMQNKEYPFYIKATTILFGLMLLCFAMFNLRDILVPLVFAIIIAILLNPLFTRLVKMRVPRILAIIITLLLAIFVIGGIFYLLSSQIATFGEKLPLLEKKFGQLLNNFQQWLLNSFGLTIKKQVQIVNEALSNSKAYVGQTLGTALGILGMVILLPVYVFLFLFYKPLIVNFLYEVFAEENSKNVGDILAQTKSAVQSYMVGLLLEAIVVAMLNSTALLILGVDYAILLGVIGAILNMLPYIGGVVAIALPLLVATITKDGYSTQLGIIGAYALIQFIDNHILIPRIVASKVQINALVSILVVLLGGALWGVSGMFLSIPFIAVIKIVFDRIEDLRPWGKLLGDVVPTRHKGQIWGKRKKASTQEKKTDSQLT